MSNPVNMGYSDTAPILLKNNEATVKSEGRLQPVAFKFALVLVFLRFSALPEILASITKVDFYLFYVFGALVIIFWVVSGGIRRTFREKPAQFWLWFVIWMWVAVPFSSWQGGSFAFATGYLKTIFIMLLAIAGFAKTWIDCRKIIYTIAAAAVFNMACAYYFKTGDDRLGFGEVAGTIGTPDDFAAHLLLVLPFLLFIALKPGTGRTFRLVSMA